MRATVVLAAVALITPAAGAANGQGSASRVVDRTVSCRVTGVGFPDPARFVTVSGSARQGEWGSGIGVHHGAGSNGWRVGARTGATPQHSTGVLYVNRTRCSTSSARLALSSARLMGGRTRTGEAYTCDVPGRVLVRVRAVFRRPVELRPDARDRATLVSNGLIGEAQLVVATPQRRPLAFATASGTTGRASVFVSPARCFVQ